MKRLKVLLILPEPPIPFKSAAARWYYALVKELGHKPIELLLHVVCTTTADAVATKEFFPKAHCFVQSNAKGFFSRIFSKFKTILKPFSYGMPNELIQSLKLLSNEVDVIHLEQTWSLWSMPTNNAKALVSIHYLAAIDLQKETHAKLKHKVLKYLQLYWEKRLLKRATIIKTCSPRLSTIIKNWYPEKTNCTLPFAIDKNLYPFASNAERPNVKKVLLIGSMNWNPGKIAAVRLLENLWPEIKRRNPDATLQIIGWHARRELLQYTKIADVEILENVEDTTPYFQKASLLLYAPELGSGMKIKVLESMLLGIPVVTNLEGLEGLPDLNPEQPYALYGNTDEELIEQTHLLLNSHQLQSIQRIRARNMIEMHCNPENVVGELLNIYKKIANNK